jgi:hypothetical protein
LEKLLKVLLLKDQWLLAQVEEIEDVTFGDPDCILVDPMLIDGDQLTDWLPFATKKEAVIRSSDIITFVDPSSDMITRYYGGKPALLTE